MKYSLEEKTRGTLILSFDVVAVTLRAWGDVLWLLAFPAFCL